MRSATSLKEEHDITLTDVAGAGGAPSSGRPTFVGELARNDDDRGLDPVSRLLGTMQRRGLVERRRPALQAVGSDARTVAIHLPRMPAAKADLDQLIPEALRYEATALARALPKTRREMLKSMLGRLFREYGPPGNGLRRQKSASPLRLHGSLPPIAEVPPRSARFAGD